MAILSLNSDVLLYTGNTCIAEPCEAQGKAHKMSGMGGQERTGVNCVTG